MGQAAEYNISVVCQTFADWPRNNFEHNTEGLCNGIVFGTEINKEAGQIPSRQAQQDGGNDQSIFCGALPSFSPIAKQESTVCLQRVRLYTY